MTTGWFALAAFYAFLRGGRAERAGGLLVVGMALVQFAARPLVADRFATLDPIPAIVDLVGFAGFTWIALYARRYWPICAAALQLLSLGAHLARAIDLAIDPWVYALQKSGPTLAVIVLLAIGTRNLQRRRQHAASMPSSPA